MAALRLRVPVAVLRLGQLGTPRDPCQGQRRDRAACAPRAPPLAAKAAASGVHRRKAYTELVDREQSCRGWSVMRCCRGRSAAWVNESRHLCRKRHFDEGCAGGRERPMCERQADAIPQEWSLGAFGNRGTLWPFRKKAGDAKWSGRLGLGGVSDILPAQPTKLPRFSCDRMPLPCATWLRRRLIARMAALGRTRPVGKLSDFGNVLAAAAIQLYAQSNSL